MKRPMQLSKAFKSKAFLLIKELWDRKLREAGFRDVECVDKHGAMRLKKWDSHCFQAKRNHTSTFLLKQEYYYMATQFLHNYPFRNKTDAHVWKLHADGFGVRHIAKILELKGVKTNKDYVAKIVHRLMRIMKEASKEECKSMNWSALD